MKNLGLILALFCSFGVTGQPTVTNMNTLSVTGSALVERTTKLYRAKISLNMEQLYYADPTCKSLDDLKEKYFKELKIQGLDASKLIEKKMAFLAYGYQRDGTVLIFETTSAEKIEKLAKVKMTGITVQYEMKTEIKPEQRRVLLRKALENAEENAERICEITAKKLGEVLTITESNIPRSKWIAYHSDYGEYITVYVTYKMN